MQGPATPQLPVFVVADTKKQIFLSLLMLAGASSISALLYLNRPPAVIEEPVYVPVTVDVAEVVKQNLRISVQAQGTVSPLQETAILSEVKGRIIEVAPGFNVGGFVSKGDVLLRIIHGITAPTCCAPRQQ